MPPEKVFRRSLALAAMVLAAQAFLPRLALAVCQEAKTGADGNDGYDAADVCSVPTTLPGGTNGSCRSTGGVDPNDYWKLTVTGWSDVTVDLNTFTTDLDLYLYDGNGNMLVASIQGGNGVAEQATTSLTAGSYYVLVNAFTGGATSYKLWATVTSKCNEPSSLSTDANNTRSDSKVCLMPSSGDSSGSLNTAADSIDWWQVRANKTGALTVQLTGLAASQNLDLYLYSTDGTTLLDSSVSGGNADDWVSASSLAAGTYYVRAVGIGAANTSYTLRTFYCTESDGTSTDGNGGYSGDNVCRLPLDNATHAGSITYDGSDIDDFYRMVVSSGAAVTVQIDLTGFTQNLDLYLYPSTGQGALATSLNTGTTAEQISISLSPGTYYVDVYDINNGGADGLTSYNLKASIPADTTAPGAPTSPAWQDGAVSSDLILTAQWTAPTDPSGIADYYVQVCEYTSPTTPDFSTCTKRYDTWIGSSATSFTLNDTQNSIALNKFYYFRVAARDGAGNPTGAPVNWTSASAAVNTLDTAPPTFYGLEQAVDPGKGGFADLEWSAATDASPPITYYIFYSTTSGGQNYSSPMDSTTSTTRRVSGLTNGTTYYLVVRAEDSLGQRETNTVEKSATPSATFISCYHATNQPPHAFEADNGGWTNSDANWAWGTPTGGGGASYGYPDPPGGYGAASGQGKVWGNNLAGDYANSASTNLTSVAFDCTNRTGNKIRFRRWLNLYGMAADIAYIDYCIGGGCTWTNLWANGGTAGVFGIAENIWSLQTINLPGSADGSTSVQIRFRLVTNASTVESGWNVDDFDIGGTSVDTTPPTFSGASSAAASGSGGILVSWAAGSDASLPVTYNVFRGSTGFSPGPSNNVAGPLTGTSYTNTGLSAGTQYCYVVRARDAIGNQETNTTERCATPTTTPPNAPLSASLAQTDGLDTPIAQGGTITSNTVKFTATMTDPDSDNVKLQVEVKPVGTAFADSPTASAATFVTSGSSQTISLNLSNGSYHWQARATDANGSAGGWTFFGTNTDPNDTDFATNGSAPDLVQAFASDTAGTPTAGISAGDRVRLNFSSNTNQPACPGVLSYLLLSSSHTWGGGASCSWIDATTLEITPAGGATVSIGDTIAIQNAGCPTTICDSGNTNAALGSPPTISGSLDAKINSLWQIRGTLQGFSSNLWTFCATADSNYAEGGANGFLGSFILSREGAAGSGDQLYVTTAAGTALRVTDGSGAIDTRCGGACGDAVGAAWHWTDESAAACAAAETEAVFFGTTTGRVVQLNFTGTSLSTATGFPFNSGTECKGTEARTLDQITTGVTGDAQLLYFGAKISGTDYACSLCWSTGGTKCVAANCTNSSLTVPRLYDCQTASPTADHTPNTDFAGRVWFAGTAAGSGIFTFDSAVGGFTNSAINYSVGTDAVYGFPYWVTTGRFYVGSSNAAGTAGAMHIFNKSNFAASYGWAPAVTGYNTGVAGVKDNQPWVTYGGIFFGDETGKLHCVKDDATGGACTGFPLQPDGANPIRSQPIVQKGVLYFSNTAGKVFAYDITTNCCTLKSPVQLTTNGYPYNLGVSLAGNIVPSYDYTQIIIGGSGGNLWYLPMWTTDPTP